MSREIEALRRIHEWLTNIGDDAPDASKTQRMALGYADDIKEVIDRESHLLDAADEQLFQAFLKFTEQRGRHEGKHVFSVTVCHECEKAYVVAEDALAVAVYQWLDARSL